MANGPRRSAARGGLVERLAEELDACRALIEDQPAGRSFQAESAVVKAQLAGVGGEVRFARPHQHRQATGTARPLPCIACQQRYAARQRNCAQRR